LLALLVLALCFSWWRFFSKPEGLDLYSLKSGG